MKLRLAPHALCADHEGGGKAFSRVSPTEAFQPMKQPSRRGEVSFHEGRFAAEVWRDHAR